MKGGTRTIIVRNTDIKIVYIASPFAGNIATNVAFAKSAAKYAIAKGMAPYIPHLTLPAVLNDNDPEERALGIKLNCEILSRCDELWVFRYHGISADMKAEINYAKEKGIPTRFLDIDPRDGVHASACQNCMNRVDRVAAKPTGKADSISCCLVKNEQRIDTQTIIRCEDFEAF